MNYVPIDSNIPYPHTRYPWNQLSGEFHNAISLITDTALRNTQLEAEKTQWNNIERQLNEQIRSLILKIEDYNKKIKELQKKVDFNEKFYSQHVKSYTSR